MNQEFVPQPKEIDVLAHIDEIFALFGDLTVIKHTCEEEAYRPYLSEGEYMLEIVNARGEENLLLNLFEDEFMTLLFAGWHAHYLHYDYDFERLKEEMSAILSGEYGVLDVFVEGVWTFSTLTKSKVSENADAKALLDMCMLHDTSIQKIREKGAELRITYWGKRTV